MDSNQKKPWSIQKRALVTSIGLATLLLFLLSGLSAGILLNSFKSLELKDAQKNIKRISESYSFVLDNYERKMIDWAQWDDTYYFMDDLNKDYIDSNLRSVTLANLNVDEMLFYKPNGDLRHAVATDTVRGKELDFPEDVEDLLHDNNVLFDELKSTGKTRGLVRTEDGVLLFVAHSIIRSDGSGPLKGYIIFGRYLGDWLAIDVGNIMQLPVKLEINDEHRATLQNPITFEPNSVYAHYWLPVQEKNSSIKLQAKMDRDVWLAGKKTITYLLVVAGVVAFACAFANYLVLYRYLLGDLISFSKEVDDIKQNSGNGSLTKRNKTSDIDELRENVNSLLNLLVSTRKKSDDVANELKKMNNLMVGRELKMIELKKKIKKLEKEG